MNSIADLPPKYNLIYSALLQFLHHHIHILLQSFNMSRTGIIIDIETIWLSIDHITLGTERLKNGLCHIPGASVGTVKTDLHTLEGIHSERNEVTHIAVTASHIINSAADGILVSFPYFILNQYFFIKKLKYWFF